MSAFVRNVIKGSMDRLFRRVNHLSSREAQLVLFNTYREMASQGRKSRFSDVGFRCYSQYEEDGILLYVFAMIGTTNKTSVEICAGDGIECMSANLIINHGWWGYLFDGNRRRVRRGRAFYRRSKDTFLRPPTFTHAWITAENVNGLIATSGIQGDVDLLTLDLDGMDYWVWKSIDCIKPRVVVCETHNVIPVEKSVTVPYDPQFRLKKPDYGGASLTAMAKLGAEKGYRLVGTHRYGFNAFFVLKDVGADLLPAVDPIDCLQDPFSREARATRWPKIKDMPWVEV
jgi:hypothetical protein